MNQDNDSWEEKERKSKEPIQESEALFREFKEDGRKYGKNKRF